MDPWLKCSDAARMLGRSRAVVERLSRLGKIATKVENGRAFYLRADVERCSGQSGNDIEIVNPVNRLLAYQREG